MLRKIQRDAYVLQMHSNEAERLKVEADSYRSITPEDFHYLMRQEALELYALEMRKDELKREAFAADDPNYDNLPSSCMKTAMQLFDRVVKVNSQLMYYEAAKAKREADKQDNRDDPMWLLKDSEKDRQWEPPKVVRGKKTTPRVEA